MTSSLARQFSLVELASTLRHLEGVVGVELTA
jgi:hypothetical protein